MKHPGFLTAKQTSKPKKGTDSPIIAGKYAGKRVLCSQTALPIFNDLVSLAKDGNYWAGLIVNSINGLSAGRLHLDNIYIEEKAGIAYGRGAFYMVLPGVTATLEEMSNGTFILQRIKADRNYLALQQKSVKPGLWRVKSDSRELPAFQQDGRIKDEKYRTVAIGGAGDNPDTAARSVRDDLVEIDPTIKRMVRDNGFDMHFTPGRGKIIGLKKASQALATSKDREIVESAILLANTMYQARNTKGVLWCSDWGGSAVLTRAMEILTQEKGVKDLKSHAIFLNRPTSSSKAAIEIAKKLGIEAHAEGKNSGWRLSEIQGHLLRTEVGANKQTGKGLVSTTSQGLSVAGAGYGIAGAALAAVGSTIALPGSMAVGLAGGLFTVASLFKTASKKLKGKKY